MTQAEKKMKKYTGSVERRLNLPREVKARVMSDFISSIAARREAGQSDEEIYGELGSPAKAAADLNEQMKDYAYRKSPWRFLFLGIAVFAGVRLLYDGITALIAHRLAAQISSGAASVGIIGGADGPTAIFITAPAWVNLAWMAALLALGAAGYLLLRHRKRKSK